MVRLWPAVALLALLLPGCFMYGYEEDDRADGSEDREFFMHAGGFWEFVLFALVIAGVVVLVVNLSNRQPPPPPKDPDHGDGNEPARRR